MDCREMEFCPHDIYYRGADGSLQMKALRAVPYSDAMIMAEWCSKRGEYTMPADSLAVPADERRVVHPYAYEDLKEALGAEYVDKHFVVSTKLAEHEEE